MARINPILKFKPHPTKTINSTQNVTNNASLENISPANIETVENIEQNEYNSELVAIPSHMMSNLFANPSQVDSSGVFVGYRVDEIKSMYNLPTPSSSSPSNKVTITIIIPYHYPNLQIDFTSFCELQGIPGASLNIVSLDASSNIIPKTGSYSYNTDPSGYMYFVEACLDVQWAYALNNTANIQVVEAYSKDLVHLMNAVKFANKPPSTSSLKKSDIISMSFGTRESILSSTYLGYKFLANSYINAFNARGTARIYYYDPSNNYSYLNSYFNDPSTCYLAASGDDNYVCWPACSPNVLACGGTSLQPTIITRETAWSSGGCGYSGFFKTPSYQSSSSYQSSVIKNEYRSIPDVSAIANPSKGVQIVYKDAIRIIGGTSASTPIIAGILSIGINDRKNTNKQSLTTCDPAQNTSIDTSGNPTFSLSFSSPRLLQNILYKNYRPNSTTQSNPNFYDVTVGNDGSFNALPNFDIPTGLGVPLLNDFNGGFLSTIADAP